MERLDEPVNLFYVDLSPERLSALKPVTTLDTFIGGTKEFHPEGLFSTEIFGRLGTDERETKFSYVDLRTTIFHPFVYKALCSLAALYKGIMEGKVYAIFDEKVKDFIKSDPIAGKTGFQFFFSRWRDIRPKETGSIGREFKIKYIKHYDVIETRQVLVLPAGKRDIEMDEQGRPIDHEINDLYRRVIQISNAFSSSTDTLDPIFDNSRLSLQQAFNEVYEHFNTMIGKGKKSFIQAKFARRAIDYGMRNVITSSNIGSPNLDDNGRISCNDTLVGQFALMAATVPIIQYEITNQWLAQKFTDDSRRAILINPQSLRSEEREISSRTLDKWRSTEGLEKIFAGFRDRKHRNKPILVEGHYLALIYRDDTTVKVFGSLDELPEGFDKSNVKPITYAEFFYYFCAEKWDVTPIFVTRYPIAGEGSIYPSFVYAKTTLPSHRLKRLDDEWREREDAYVYREFPDMNDVSWFETMSPHPRMLGGLGGDHDGDMVSGNCTFSAEALKEIQDYLNSSEAYIGAGGELRNSPFTETIERVFFSLSGE